MSSLKNSVPGFLDEASAPSPFVLSRSYCRGGCSLVVLSFFAINLCFSSQKIKNNKGYEGRWSPAYTCSLSNVGITTFTTICHMTSCVISYLSISLLSLGKRCPLLIFVRASPDLGLHSHRLSKMGDFILSRCSSATHTLHYSD